MVDVETESLKMVEFNTIAASFGNLSERIRKSQVDLMEKYSNDFQFNYPLEQLLDKNFFGYDYAKQQAKTFAEALKAYAPDREVYVLLLIPEDERNTIDQEIVIATLQREYSVKALRRKFSELEYEIDPNSKHLLVEGKEVGLVYYRTGY